MNAQKFEAEIDHWIAELRDNVLRLHADGVQAEQCLGIAIQIATAKAAKRVLDRQRLGIAEPGGLVRP